MNKTLKRLKRNAMYKKWRGLSAKKKKILNNGMARALGTIGDKLYESNKRKAAN